MTLSTWKYLTDVSPNQLLHALRKHRITGPFEFRPYGNQRWVYLVSKDGLSLGTVLRHCEDYRIEFDWIRCIFSSYIPWFSICHPIFSSHWSSFRP